MQQDQQSLDQARSEQDARASRIRRESILRLQDALDAHIATGQFSEGASQDDYNNAIRDLEQGRSSH